MDKYALLIQNPQRCKRLFGLEFELLENLLKKVQNLHNRLKEENPLSKRGLHSELGFENQFCFAIFFALGAFTL